MEKKRVLAVAAVLLLAAVAAVVVPVAVVFTRRAKFEPTFMRRCERFEGVDCQKMWAALKQAFVGKDPCQVPVEAYDPFIALFSFPSACNTMMFWSKTKDVVHNFTEKKKDCFVTLEDTILGNILDGLTWCSKEGSKEIFTDGCPGWNECVNNSVRSFWTRASAAFADSACGDVTVMLNGGITTPFSLESMFASVELKRLRSPRVKSLTVVLVAQNFVTNCKDTSLKNLQSDLDKGIQYDCTEVTKTHINECASDKNQPCSCWQKRTE